MKFVGVFSLFSIALGLTLEEHGVELPKLRKRAIQSGVQTYECLIPGTFAMTFDDGPYIYTRQLLSILRRLRVKATFFVVGEMVDNDDYGSILAEMAAEGHQIASHSYTHPHLNELSHDRLVEEIAKTSTAIERRLGTRVNYFRCPYGECDDRVLSVLGGMGYKVINWNLDTLDWTGKSTADILAVYRDSLNDVNPRSSAFISLQHDIQPNTIAVVSRLIKTVRDKGFRLTTVKECMGE
ncbi:hypothetical protein DSO57_1012191 [Entomophthora muscae]|uniref:Uncharacterized protein n=1 Tax=Entomophthora muscae TaxID=34485 RepID=A0ACC2UFJ3_9FUNG|nr:hypothetical protein DSO57_1012191 [Entomophthora muscae]